MFARAEGLAPGAADRLAPARLLHYRALNELNQGHDRQALALLDRAEADYAARVPPDVLNGTATAQAPRTTLSPLNITPNPEAAGRLLIDPEQRTALMGVVETRRYRAIVLRDMHRQAESDAAPASA